MYVAKWRRTSLCGYICNPDKTDNGKYVISNLCVPTPQGASKEFAEIRIGIGGGKARTECQHIIQSFAPNEVTPEQAILIGQELCKRLFNNEYQYVLATHTNTDCIHNHIIINNVNFFTGKTFETEHNQGKIPERAWAKLLSVSDEICKENHLSVIEDHSSTKGKSHFEWEVDKLNLSWKAKLKQAIDEVVMISDDFADFLKKCADHGIIVEYNPEHKIDIKFMLAEQKERNPRAKMTRGRTLGWFYEGKQIAKRIENYKKYMNYKPSDSIIRTASDKFLDTPALSAWVTPHSVGRCHEVTEGTGDRWEERENMKAASKAINEMTATNSTLEELEKAAHSAFSKRMERTQRMNAINSRLKELEQIMPLLEKYHKYQEIYKTYRSMAEGRQKKKYGEKCSYEIGECRSAASELRKFYPDGNVPSLKSLKKEQDRLLTEYEQVSAEYKFYKKESDRISKDVQKKRSSEKVVKQFIVNEKETERRRKNRNGLE